MKPAVGIQLSGAGLHWSSVYDTVDAAVEPKVDETVTVCAEFVPAGTFAQREKIADASAATVWVVADIAESK